MLMPVLIHSVILLMLLLLFLIYDIVWCLRDFTDFLPQGLMLY